MESEPRENEGGEEEEEGGEEEEEGGEKEEEGIKKARKKGWIWRDEGVEEKMRS